MTTNPFIYNVPVRSDQFVGRREQVDQILGQLLSARGSSAVSGDPRVGKTSLLHYLCVSQVYEARGLSAGWCHFLSIDCQAITPFSDSAFWRYTLRMLEPALGDDDHLSNRIRRIRQMLADADPDIIFDLHSLFDQVARSGRLVVLVLDEFEGIVENLNQKTPDLLYHLRTLLNRPERGLALVVASREPLAKLCAKFQFTGSPFDNAFLAINLPPFNQTEINHLLRRSEIDFSPAEKQWLHATAGPHPYLIQLAGGLLLQLRERLSVENLLEPQLSRLEKTFEQETERYFIDMLKYTSDVERMILTLLALAQLHRLVPADKLDALETDILPPDFGRFEHEVNRLRERGLVTLQPEPALFSPVWGRSILRALAQAGREAVTNWQPQLVAFLSPAQQKFFQTLAHVVIDRPNVINNPELLADHLAEYEPAQPFSPRQPARAIRITGGIFPDDLEREVIKKLYSQNDHLNISRVRLEKKFDGGLSGMQVLLAQPIDDRDRELAYEVIKIAPATMLRREHKRYQQYVQGRLPATAVRLENGPVELNTLGCLSYGFAGDRPVGMIKDLENYYAAHSAEEVVASLTGLIKSLHARWYGHHIPLLASFADEYGQQLPAHLQLRAERIVRGEITVPPVHRRVDIQTALNAQDHLEIGDPIVITGLQVSQVTPTVVKLHSTGDGTTAWIRARTPVPYPNFQEEDVVNVVGTVEIRRDDVLNAAAANILNFNPDLRRCSNGGVELAGLPRPCADPLAIYKQILRQQLRGWKTIIHGDLHPGNIMVDDKGRAWLIDFDHVREGHVLYDFIRLEIHMRLFALGGYRRSRRLGNGVSPTFTEWPHAFTLAEYIAFEQSLLRQTLKQPAAEITQPDLAKAAQVILAIRHLAEDYLRQRDNWREYLGGLFLQSLAQLRFYRKEPWLGVMPFTAAAIVGEDLVKDGD